MSKIVKFGVEFTLKEVDEDIFMELLNSVGFNVIFEEIENEKKKLGDKLVHYTNEAAKAAEFGKWNHKTPEEYAELIDAELKKIPQLLVWDVKDRFSDRDKNGNSYSQLRYNGLKVTNSLLNVAYYFK